MKNYKAEGKWRVGHLWGSMYPSASDLISIPNHQPTCKEVIVRLWPSLFAIPPTEGGGESCS